MIEHVYAALIRPNTHGLCDSWSSKEEMIGIVPALIKRASELWENDAKVAVPEEPPTARFAILGDHLIRQELPKNYAMRSTAALRERKHFSCSVHLGAKVRKQAIAACLFVWRNIFQLFARFFARQPLVEYRYREYLNTCALFVEINIY